MADVVIKNAEFLITTARSPKISRGATLVVSDGRIEDVAHRDSSGRIPGADAVIDGRKKVVLPGLVNAHVHVEETLGMNMISDTVRHIPWFERWILPYYESLTESDAYYSALLSQVLMLRGGITCYADSASRYPESSARAASESGIRAFLARWTCDTGKYLPSPIEECVRETDRLLRRYSSGRIMALASVIGLNQCSDELYLAIKQLAEDRGVVVTSHESSGHEDVERCLKRKGLRPVENLAKIGFLSPRTLLSHLTDVSKREVALLARSGTKVSLCPSAELKKGKGLFHYGKLPLMIRAGVKFSLGTDTANSSNHLNVLKAANLLLLLAKDHAMDPRILDAGRVLDMATGEGAHCLGLDDDKEGRYGRIEEGSIADIAIFNLDDMEWFSMNQDPVQWLLYGDNPRAYSTIVDGKVAYLDGRFALPKINLVLEQCKRRSERIRSDVISSRKA